MTKFLFELEERATLHSGETGVVIGRAEFSGSENSYQLRYTNGQGCQVEVWHSQSAFKFPV